MNRRWRVFLRNRTALLGALLVALVALTALGADWIATHDPETRTDSFREPPSTANWLGTVMITSS